MRNCFIVALLVGSAANVNAQNWKFGEPEKVGGTINSAAEESIPVFSKDQSTLFFVRTMDGENAGGEMDQDIWYSTLNQEGNYSDCKRLTALNNKFNNAVFSLSSTGKSMYLINAYDGKKDEMKGIAVSHAEGSNWSSPEKVEIPGLDIDGDYYSFFIDESESVLILSYAGPASKGEEDLYVSTKSSGAWSSLTHMGSTINSTGYELSPFLSKSMDTLFFSSNGFGGQGEADIFFSVKQGSWTNWSKPENMGGKINSPKFDAYFSLKGNRAYWSSNRDGGLSDIYTLEFVQSTPLVTNCTAANATTFKGKNGSISLSVSGGIAPYVYEWSNGASVKDISGLSKGSYSVKITDAMGQIAENTCFVDEPAEAQVAFKELEFKHSFGYNKNKVDGSNQDLKKFLNDLDTQLKDGRGQVTINVISSASNVPTKTFGTNEALAQSRADNIKKLVEAHYGTSKFKDRVSVVISKVAVQGVPYEADGSNQEKYVPFQYVQLVTK